MRPEGAPSKIDKGKEEFKRFEEELVEHHRGEMKRELAGKLVLQLGVLGGAGPPDAIRLPEGTVAALQREQGMVGAVARPLFDTYLIPFEITSILLLAAIVGAVVLAKRKL